MNKKSAPKRDEKDQQLYEYVREVADKLALRDWGFDIIQETPQELADTSTDMSDTFACIQPTEGRKYAQISVRRDFWTSKPELQRYTVVHELIHCHMAPACFVVEGILKVKVQKAFDL